MTEIQGVFVRLGKFLIVCALASALGWHWALLQTVAWTTMLAANLRGHSFSESVERTFDGNHPCPMCKAIAAAKKSEKKGQPALQITRLEFPPAPKNFAVLAPAQFQLLPTAQDTFADALPQKPLTPPPRGFFV